MTPKFPVGTKFIRRVNFKNDEVCTVVDIHTTCNLAGEVVRIGYVATHVFLGQTIEERDIPELLIARNVINPELPPSQ